MYFCDFSYSFVGHGKQCKLDQMPQNTASDQVLHCLLTEVSLSEKYHPTTLKLEMDLSNWEGWENTFGINGLKGAAFSPGYSQLRPRENYFYVGAKNGDMNSSWF